MQILNLFVIFGYIEMESQRRRVEGDELEGTVTTYAALLLPQQMMKWRAVRAKLEEGAMCAVLLLLQQSTKWRDELEGVCCFVVSATIRVNDSEQPFF